MKDIIKVSLSGVAFVVDEEAFVVLDSYMKRLEASYRNNPDGGEIIADIEARIVEIILTKQNCDTIVCKELVDSIIEQLGVPEEECTDVSASTSMDSGLTTFPRRLYRNPEGAKLGGVFSGLGTFFNVDAVWLRLGFFSPLILLILISTLRIPYIGGFLGTTFATLFLSYIVLWFAIPIAKTPRQRLEMRGERITASSIRNDFREDFTQMSGNSQKSRRSASVLAELVYVLGRVLLFGVKVFALLIGFVLAVGAIILLAASCMLIFGDVSGSTGNIIQLLQINSMSAPTFIGLLGLVIFAPLVILLYLLLRLVFNLPANRTGIYIILGLWLVLMSYVGYVAVNNFDDIKHSVQSFRNEVYYEDVDVDEDMVVTEGIIEGDSTRTDSVVVRINGINIVNRARR